MTRRIIAVSQRVVIDDKTGERRDALDQNWSAFLEKCGCIPLLIPNRPEVAKQILKRISIDGILLTGGNDLCEYGGDAAERDETERFLLKVSFKKRIPLLGVCRGMQVIQNFFGIRLERVRGHVAARQTIRINGKKTEVNSFHDWGAKNTKTPLQVWAVADDGVIKAVRHSEAFLCGLMWHPERFKPFRAGDIKRVKNFFKPPYGSSL